MDAFVHRRGGQVQDIKKPLVPDLQAKIFVKDTEPLRHIRHDRLKIGVFAQGFAGV